MKSVVHMQSAALLTPDIHRFPAVHMVAIFYWKDCEYQSHL